MFNSQKNVFWEALLVTIFIFGVGILSGILIENYRTSQITQLSQLSEVELLDIKLQNELYAAGSFDCSIAVEENFNFANKIYNEAVLLEKYEKAKKLTNDIIVQHKKYDILRAMLLMNSIEIKKNCNVTYHDVVYFYQYDTPRLDIQAKQDVLSNILGEVKKEKGRNLLLIPMAADNSISSISIILRNYNISIDEIPVVLIDEKIKLKDISSGQDIEPYLN